MSDTDSFIDEVTEEVRRDRMFFMLKRYGWIAVLVILAIVGGASWREYSKAQARAEAQALGDSILSALEQDDASARANDLGSIAADAAGSQAILGLIQAASLVEAGRVDDAVAKLNGVAVLGDVPQVYRQIATFKALLLQGDSLSVADRRLQFEALATPGGPLRLRAEEQLALIEVSQGDAAAAITRLQAIIDDSEASTDLQQRASQVIVALGGTPSLGGATNG
jgi:hypothetical protein